MNSEGLDVMPVP